MDTKEDVRWQAEIFSGSERIALIPIENWSHYVNGVELVRTDKSICHVIGGMVIITETKKGKEERLKVMLDDFPF